MNKFIIITLLTVLLMPVIVLADEKVEFQEMVRTILETGGEMKTITDTFRPNTRLYVYKQLPSIKENINKNEKIILDIKAKADNVIKNQDLHLIVQNMASIQYLTIQVAKELLEIYEKNGIISQKDYNNVVSKYEKEAKRLQKSLEHYKNM